MRFLILKRGGVASCYRQINLGDLTTNVNRDGSEWLRHDLICAVPAYASAPFQLGGRWDKWHVQRKVQLAGTYLSILCVGWNQNGPKKSPRNHKNPNLSFSLQCVCNISTVGTTSKRRRTQAPFRLRKKQKKETRKQPHVIVYSSAWVVWFDSLPPSPRHERV